MSKTNFLLGLSPGSYTSTHLAEHQKKFVDHYDKMFRLKTLNKNTQSNFVHENGFEKNIEENRILGPLPHKGKLD